MLIEVARVNQRVTRLALRPTAWPRTLGRAVDGTGGRQAQQAAIAVASKGLAPIRRKAVWNAKRLARTRLRREGAHSEPSSRCARSPRQRGIGDRASCRNAPGGDPSTSAVKFRPDGRGRDQFDSGDCHATQLWAPPQRSPAAGDRCRDRARPGHCRRSDCAVAWPTTHVRRRDSRDRSPGRLRGAVALAALLEAPPDRPMARMREVVHAGHQDAAPSTLPRLRFGMA